jgi:hypothetical protein
VAGLWASSLVATPVHTTGVNWESVATITGVLVVILTAILGLFAKWIAAQITGAIDRFHLNVITVLDKRLSALELTVNATRKRQTRDDLPD